MAAAHLHAGRGALPEHPHAAQRRRATRRSPSAAARPSTSSRSPLNNRGWLRARFAEVRAHRAGSGSTGGHRPHRPMDGPRPGRLLRRSRQPVEAAAPGARPGFEKDPGSVAVDVVGFVYRPEWRLSWMTHAESFWDTPLRMRYPGLDSAARYRVRVVYAGETVQRDHAAPPRGERRHRESTRRSRRSRR